MCRYPSFLCFCRLKYYKSEIGEGKLNLYSTIRSMMKRTCAKGTLKLSTEGGLCNVQENTTTDIFVLKDA